ncbi:MAG: hypothetical protein RBG13Loki_4346 [Promethearchaeota archaeon CR_4]|nr:MAG: hypothetical protein RBG13Loki_4346 [Candidatus Lokiarchaeota archaeon CR_4]
MWKLPLLKPHLLAYKISSTGTFEEIDYKQLLNAFTPVSALGIYAYKSKRLYFWKGENLPFNLGKVIPEAKRFFLAQDDRMIVLRHFIIESGDEPQEFLDDLKVKAAQLRDQLLTTHQEPSPIPSSQPSPEPQIVTPSPSTSLVEKTKTEVHTKIAEEKNRTRRIALIKERISSLFGEIPKLCKLRGYEGALEKLEEINILVQRNRLSEFQDQIETQRENVLTQRAAYFKDLDQISVLEKIIREAQTAKQWQALIPPSELIIEIAERIGKKDLVTQYTKVLLEAREKLKEEEWNKMKTGVEPPQTAARPKPTPSQEIEDTKVIDHLFSALQLAELRFTNAHAKNIFFESMKAIADILEIAGKLNQTNLIRKYEEIKKEITTKLELNAKNYAKRLEKIEQINQLKKDAVDLETRLLFEEARQKTIEIKALALELDDKPTITSCERKIRQLNTWTKDTSDSDLLKWDIPVENIINDQKYHLLEAFNDEEVAQKRAEEILTNSGKTESVRVITLTQAKFVNQGPFNGNGKCFIIYGAKASS